MKTLLETVRTNVRKLRWRLTLSYTAVTVGALVVVLLLLALLILPSILVPNELLNPSSAAFWVQATNQQAVPLTRYLLSESPVNTEGIAALVNYSETARFGRFDLLKAGNFHIYAGLTTEIEMLILSADGTLLGRTHYPAFPSEGLSFDASSIPGLEKPLQAALAGEREPNLLVEMHSPVNDIIVAAPVFGFDEASDQLLGAVVYIAKKIPSQNDLSSHTLSLTARAVILFLLAAAIAGTFFGALTAKRLGERFINLRQAANAWSQGDFSKFITDTSGDEISQLAQRLNSMAVQLQQLLTRKQEMAISEERNRLARELHDSAKQQALAASFQLGTAITLFERDPENAEKHLLEAEALVDTVRKELTDLILELRPPTLNGRDIGDILSEFAAEWAHQNGVVVDIDIQQQISLSFELTQTLYRITQEAFANISRHSQAQSAVLVLKSRDDTVILTITDDGCGFDTAQEYNGLGLLSMGERAELHHGTFSIKSMPGQGTKIVATFPCSTQRTHYPE